MSPPLHGVRVLDLTRLLPGPFATMILVDLGAQVDKVEDPGGGDYLRFMPPQVDGMNAVFAGLNRGKRSLVLDLKRSEGRDALLRLVPAYDVLIESFRPGVMDRLGLGREALRAAHPGLVHCALTGYGQDGPLASRAGHDLDYLARAGVLGLTGPEGGPPQVPGVQMADFGGGLYAVAGVLAALFGRARDGEGRFVDISMCEGAVSFATFGLVSHFAGAAGGPGQGALAGGIAPYRSYATKDGRAVALAALEPKFWIAFCTGVGLEPDMQALVPGPHQAALVDRLTSIFADRTLDEWVSFAEAQDCCLEPVLLPEELPEDPQHRARGVFDAEPAAFPRTPLGRSPRGPAPGHGEGGEAVLTDAGFDEEAIAALREQGVLG